MYYLFGAEHIIQPLTANLETYYFCGINEQSVNDMNLPNRKGFVYYNDTLEDLPVIFYTGASICVTPNRDDFFTYTFSNDLSLNNVSGKSGSLGMGQIECTLYDDTGCLHTIRALAYYVPDARVRLFSIQGYIHNYG